MEHNTEAMSVCYGFDSRIASRRANIFMLVVTSVYLILNLIRLDHDNTPIVEPDPFQNMDVTPKGNERIHLKLVLCVTTIQMIANSLAIWGTTTYCRWPVIFGLGWIFVNLVVLTCGSIYASMFTFGSSGLSVLVEGTIILELQFFFILRPMYQYIQEYEKLKELSASHDEVEQDLKQNLLETV